MSFVHLHVHSEYSLLDGYARVANLVQAARAQNAPAIALTDHGSMAATITFLQACKDEGIKPIVGCELYVATRSRLEHGGQLDRTHLTVLARNQVGLTNLFRLVSEAHLTGYYYKPRVDYELLDKHREGLIVLSGCISSHLSNLLLEGQEEQAAELVGWFQRRWGDDYYIEVQSHPATEFDNLLERSVALANKCGVQIVGTNDVHYVARSDARIQGILSAIGKGRADEDKLLDDYYLKPPEQLAIEFARIPSAITNTIAIADKVEIVQLPKHVEVPLVPVLRQYAGTSEKKRNVVALDYVRQQCLERLHSTFGDDLPTEYAERLDYELDIIEKTGFATYILLVADICRFAREAGIRFGPRGSAAGALVCYGLRISEPDPLEHGLVFERFLNPERIEMPDIDLDFQDDRRHEIYEYLRDTYGEDRVAAVATYGTLGARAAVKDVARALGVDYQKTELLTRKMAGAASLDEALELNAVKELLKDQDLARAFAQARPLEGIARHISTHAAGIVLSAKPLTERAPLARCPRDESKIQVQYEGELLQKAGLLKMDILGLDNLTILDRALKTIFKRTGKQIDVWNLPWDDVITYDMLCRGRVHGVFQLGTSSGKRLTSEVQPHKLHDLMALVALNRPGPIDVAPRFAAVKRGDEPIRSPHPLVDDIVAPTNGVVIYQEQVLQIARKVAGFSYGEADILRKAIGKKIEKLMQEQHGKFIDRAVAHSQITAEEAESIWSYFEPFARYGFNLAHACCYAYLAFQTAYLKANYPLEFMTAALDVADDNHDKIAAGVAEAIALGLEILPPSIHDSATGFVVEGDAIRYGLNAVKNVGAEAANAIVLNRPYPTLGDLVIRTAIPRPAIESLIKIGATGFASRAAELDVLDSVIAAGTRVRRARDSGQLSMFDETEFVPRPSLLVEQSPLSSRLEWERELCGVWVSDNPLKQLTREVGADTTAELVNGQAAMLVGEVRDLRVLTAHASQKQFIVGELADLAGTIKLVCFARQYTATAPLWENGTLRIVHGKIDEYEGAPQIVVDQIEEYREPPPPDATVCFQHGGDPDPWLRAAGLAVDNPGSAKLRLQLLSGQGEQVRLAQRDFMVTTQTVTQIQAIRNATSPNGALAG